MKVFVCVYGGGGGGGIQPVDGQGKREPNAAFRVQFSSRNYQKDIKRRIINLLKYTRTVQAS